jgi:hypothetical protein
VTARPGEIAYLIGVGILELAIASYVAITLAFALVCLNGIILPELFLIPLVFVVIGLALVVGGKIWIGCANDHRRP